jgi:hypothetical protein
LDHFSSLLSISSLSSHEQIQRIIFLMTRHHMKLE